MNQKTDNIITKSQKSYLRNKKFWKNKEKLAEKTILNLKEQIVEQEKIITKCGKNRAWWGDELIRPIIDEIEKRTGLIHDSHDEKGLIPLGMKARVSVFFYNKRKTPKYIKQRDGTTTKTIFGRLKYSLTFLPEDLEHGKMYLESRKTKDGRKASEISHVQDPNRFCTLDVPCPETIEEIIKFMEKNQ